MSAGKAKFGITGVDWQQRINWDRLRNYRIERAREKMKEHGSQAWLVNTGWSGGGYGVGERMSLSHTRGIIDAIHDGSLAKAPTEKDPIFGLDVVEPQIPRLPTGLEPSPEDV